MEDFFDSMIESGGMASGLFQVANLFNAYDNQNNALEASLYDRSLRSQSDLMKMRILENQFNVGERQFRQQSRQAAREQAYRQEQSSFERLNQSLNFQLKIAEKETEARNQAFAKSLQAMQFDLQSQNQMMQLEALQNQSTARKKSGEVTRIISELQGATENSDFKNMQRLHGDLGKVMTSSWFGYSDLAVQENVRLAHQASAKAVHAVDSLNDFGNVIEAVSVDQLPTKIIDATTRSNLTPSDLQILGYFKELTKTALGDGELSDNEVEGVKKEMIGFFGEDKANTIFDQWLGDDGKKAQFISRMSYAPEKPLRGDDLYRYVGATAGLNEAEKRILSDTVLPDKTKNALLQNLKEERLRAFYSATGSQAPEIESSNAQTTPVQVLQDRIIEYQMSDFGLSADSVLPSERSYYRRTVTRPGSSRTREQLTVEPLKFKDNNGNITKEFKEAYLRGELYYNPRETKRSPDGPYDYNIFTGRGLKKIDPINAREIKRLSSDLTQSRNEFVELFTPNRFGSSMIRRTPEEIVSGMNTRLSVFLDDIDVKYRGGVSGQRFKLSVGQFIPPAYAHRSDLIVSALQKDNILPGKSGYANDFVNYAQNLNTLQLYYKLSTDPLNLTSSLNQRMNQYNRSQQNGSGQQPVAGGNMMQNTFGDPLID